MIDDGEILDGFRMQLGREIADSCSIATRPPLPISVWIASSLLQKAIRRGRFDDALAAAATLLVADAPRLWRRLTVIAWEDIGIADVEAVGLVTSSAGGSRVRKTLGTEWAVAAHLVGRLCSSPKSRAADDLLMASDRVSAFARQRAELAYWDDTRLCRLVQGDEVPPTRAIGLRYLWGTPRGFNEPMIARQGDPERALAVLGESGVPPTLRALIREGIRTSRTALPLLAGLLFPSIDRSTLQLEADPLPPEGRVGGVPTWALDMFTREGKEALRRLMRGTAPLARFLSQLPLSMPLPGAMGNLLFFAEGGLLAPRARDALSDSLRSLCEIEGVGLPPERAAEALTLMRDALPALNAIRAEILGGH